MYLTQNRTFQSICAVIYKCSSFDYPVYKSALKIVLAKVVVLLGPKEAYDYNKKLAKKLERLGYE